MRLINSLALARSFAIKAAGRPSTIAADSFLTKPIKSVKGWRPGSRPAAWIAALLLTGALSACADYRSYEECGKGGCPDDANITANIQGLFAQHRELEGPDQLYVKTIDHVVYLSGTVETGLHRDTAESVAREVRGVSSVVNNIAIDK
jgi:hyperosmotically inducible protein